MFPQTAPAVQAAYCLVNLWIISGEFPLNCGNTADSSWLFCGEQTEARCSPGPALHFACSLFPGPHQCTVCPSPCPRRSPLCSSSVILALLQTHSTDILKNSGIHPQYGFLLIIAFCLWRLHLFIDFAIQWLFAELSFPPPLYISVKASNNTHPDFL